jgi:hypothetical protein
MSPCQGVHAQADAVPGVQRGVPAVRSVGLCSPHYPRQCEPLFLESDGTPGTLATLATPAPLAPRFIVPAVSGGGSAWLILLATSSHAMRTIVSWVEWHPMTRRVMSARPYPEDDAVGGGGGGGAARAQSRAQGRTWRVLLAKSSNRTLRRRLSC